MKRFLTICSLAAAFLCLAQNASAQYTYPISRSGANLVDDNGNKLSDAQIVEAVGADIYTQTVVGARKQVKAGRGLIWGGVAGMVAGTAGVVAGMVMVNKNAHYDSNKQLIYDNKEKAMTGAALYLLGGVVAGVGSLAVDFGIPLAIIGSKRLNWVADQANAEVSYNFGLTPSGVGFALNF